MITNGAFYIFQLDIVQIDNNSLIKHLLDYLYKFY